MTKEEFINRMWTEYPRDLCHNRPGTKPNLETAANKIKPSEYEQILLDMEAVKIYDRKQYKPDRWPNASRFLNGRYWERVLESTMKTDEIRKTKYCQCGQPVQITAYGLCIECYRKITENREIVKKTLKAIGVYKEGQSLREVSQNCREYLKQGNKCGSLSKKMNLLENS